MGLGPFEGVSLKAARIQAAAQRRLILEGRDPIDERRAQQEVQNRESGRKVTFEAVALAYIEAQRPGWKSRKHGKQWEAILRTYAFPHIGRKAPAEITTEDVLAILQPIWGSRPETARRVRNRIETILNSAKAQNLREGENVAAWRGHLELLLTKQKAKARGHHAALPWQQAPAFWQAIKDHSDLPACAVRLTLLTALRTSEVMGARWGEIDLEAMPRIAGSDYLFPG